MGLREIAVFVKISHDVANSGGAQIITALLGDGTRGYRFASLDVRLDDGMQHVLFAMSHLMQRQRMSLRGSTPTPTDLIVKGFWLVVKRLLRLCEALRCGVR